LTALGAIGAVALLVSPVGFQLFATLTKDNHSGIPWPFWVPFLLGSAPLIVALYVMFVWLRAFMRREAKPLPSLIYSSAENRTTTSSNRTAEPTSVEFEEAYCELLRDAISNKERKVVVVIDNLDRLEKDDAKDVWSTLRTFFDKPLRHEDWFRKTWILVPFDKTSLTQAGEDEESRDTTRSPFIEKTFQAFFRIPPALLTNWEAYLIQQLELAFPEHKGTGEFHDIFRLYDYLREPLSEAPTPRQIKLFVK